MKLYLLTPYPYDTSYNNYMNNYFKFNNWANMLDDILECVYINTYQTEGSLLQGNVPNKNDYLLVCDIQNINIQKYYDDYIHLFEKDKRFVFLYECLMHDIHKWKIDYVKNNFKLIFQNCTDLVSLCKEHICWIPCWNLYIKHDNYNSKKKGFCVVSPIFDLGLKKPLDEKRTERLKLIREYCTYSSKIHVYGNQEFEEYIPLINFVGKLPNEETCGLYGSVNIEEKIINKCKLLSKYKFVLVFESLFVNGFVSEKLVESLYSNSVVIYYGPPNIEEIYPDLFKDCVFNGHKYNVKEIMQIMENMSEEEYEKRVNGAVKLRDDLNYNNSSENIKKIVAAKIKEEIKKETINKI